MTRLVISRLVPTRLGRVRARQHGRLTEEQVAVPGQNADHPLPRLLMDESVEPLGDVHDELGHAVDDVSRQPEIIRWSAPRSRWPGQTATCASVRATRSTPARRAADARVAEQVAPRRHAQDELAPIGRRPAK